MKRMTIDFEPMIRDIVAEEITRQLAPQLERAHAKAEGVSEESEYLGITELSELTGLKKATIYAKRSRREIPAYKFGRELRFRRTEIDDWMETKRQTCLTDNEAGAKNNHFINHKKELKWEV